MLPIRGNSRKKPLKEACHSLLTLAIGFASCSVIAVLAYFTFQTAAGNRSYCTLWTDIPGRLVIFLTFYYAAGVCGALPIPEHFRMNFLPPPFLLYRLESWKEVWGKMCLLFTFDCQMYEAFVNDPEMSPLRHRSNERSYDTSPTPREQSEKIPIAKAGTSRKYAVRSSKAARNRDVETADSYEDCSMSLDSSVVGPVVPMTKGKFAKDPYFVYSTLSTTETSCKSISNAPTGTSYEISETLSTRTKAFTACTETDTPPRTPELSFPNYPRFPWVFLKHPGGVPQEAKALNKRHRVAERRELEKFNKKQKLEKMGHSQKDDDSDWRTDSDELNPFAYRQLRLPLVTARSRTGYRGRTKTTPGAIWEKSTTKRHKRMFSCGAPHKNQSCTFAKFSPKSEDNSNKDDENSLDLQSKVEYIKQALIRLAPRLQAGCEASTSRQHVDAHPSKQSDAEANFPSKTSRAEELTSMQNSDTSSGPKSDSNASSNK